ncbi:MAG TPA: sigma-70 family RNA polymerase sigma factor [Gemmatimonadota bacterium]|nr:sigma-70 family RNA polymerase sigma factor [Gemmatimonadota bacterium]
MTSSGAFPRTRITVIERIRSEAPDERRRAFGSLVEAYWKPIYAYLRLRWRLPPEEARDATQSFLAAAFEKRWLERYDPSRARFRTFLRTCVDRFAMNRNQAARRQKRGGGARIVGLDFETAEGEILERPLEDPVDQEELFRREWIRDLFARSVAEVRRECAANGQAVRFELFERYDLGPDAGLSYADLAAELGLSVSQVTNGLAAVRRAFRSRVLAKLREACGTHEEFRAEAREIFGIEVE